MGKLFPRSLGHLYLYQDKDDDKRQEEPFLFRNSFALDWVGRFACFALVLAGEGVGTYLWGHFQPPVTVTHPAAVL